MDTIFIILGLLLVAGGVMIYFVKAGKIKDSDGDLIPDAVEDAIKDVKETAAEVKDIAKAVKGRKRRGRKPRAKK